MKYSVDRIENEIVILENIENKEILQVNIKDFDEEIKEGNIIKLVDNNYVIDNEEEEKRKNSVKNRFNKLKK